MAKGTLQLKSTPIKMKSLHGLYLASLLRWPTWYRSWCTACTASTRAAGWARSWRSRSCRSRPSPCPMNCPCRCRPSLSCRLTAICWRTCQSCQSRFPNRAGINFNKIASLTRLDYFCNEPVWPDWAILQWTSVSRLGYFWIARLGYFWIARLGYFWIASVTRLGYFLIASGPDLGYFWNVFATNFGTKVAQIFVNSLVYFKNVTFKVKPAAATCLGNFWINWASFIPTFWSHCKEQTNLKWRLRFNVKIVIIGLT